MMCKLSSSRGANQLFTVYLDEQRVSFSDPLYVRRQHVVREQLHV